ncbi:hypothetical protein EI94DRAFT_1872922 [Lactarius quietus]|nr:hypothetical protein EI94DRAFT_1789198 [Lactarius quietus]KAF8264076.1 hypothetical protein EI94DRAFT_1872922 [Lactarius quietus]
MEKAKRKDSVQWRRSDEWGPINFVLLQSPLFVLHDPESIISDSDIRGARRQSAPSINFWNFSRCKDRARITQITLEQNLHFYLRFPASEDESAYTPTLQRHPLRDPSGALEHNGTIYVLFNRSGRLMIFGNVWSLNGLLIFRVLGYLTDNDFSEVSEIILVPRKTSRKDLGIDPEASREFEVTVAAVFSPSWSIPWSPMTTARMS